MNATHRHGTWSGAILLAGALAWAPGARAEVTYNGYLSERLQLTLPSESALISTRDMAIAQSLTEANIQGRFRAMDERLYIYADLSAFASVAGGYADRKKDSHRLDFVKDHDVASYRPLFVISEAYAQYDFTEHLRVTVGKKRIVWGTGMAFNPTDLLNPPRDPTDPNFQRAGAYLAALDAPFEHFTLSAVAAPKVLYSYSGIPAWFFMYPGYVPAETARNPAVFADPRDNQPHYAVAARAYALFKEADINLWVVHTNRYNDDLENEPRAAFSFSRYFFTDYEFHVEGLLQMGSPRNYVQPDCVVSDAAALACLQSGGGLQKQKWRDSTDLFPRFLMGTRTILKDDSILSFEYLYQADGYDRDEFRDVMRLQRRIGNFVRETGGAGMPSSGASSGGELPVRFSFDPLRRHYLIANYIKMQIMDDWSVNLTGIMALEDFSSLATGSVTWNAQQWMNLSVFAFVPLPSPGRLSSRSPWDPMGRLQERLGDSWGTLVPAGAEVDGERYGEYDSTPFRARVTAEMRIFF